MGHFCFCLKTLKSAHHHHHHQVPDLEQTLAPMPLQTSLSSDNFKKFKPLLCPPVAELQKLSRNVILCLPLSRLPSTFPVKDKNSKPLRLHTCPNKSAKDFKTTHITPFTVWGWVLFLFFLCLPIRVGNEKSYQSCECHKQFRIWGNQLVSTSTPSIDKRE